VGSGHSHVHDHGHVHVDRRVARILAIVVGAIAVVGLVGLIVLWPGGRERTGSDVAGAEWVSATVTAIAEAPCPDLEFTARECVTIDARLRDGEVANFNEVLAPSFPVPSVGDRIVLGDTGLGGYYFVDFDRDRPMLALLAVFVVAVLALGRWRGLGALAGLALSIAVIVWFLIPSITSGSSPLAAALVTSVVVATSALFLAHGVSASTSVALIGTMCSLAVTGALAAVFIALAHITGLVSEEGAYLSIGGGAVDVRGLLLAGIIVGSLGVLDDVTVTQVAAVVELRRQNASASFREVFAPAMRIGRDHVSSTVNTLVLAYVGASLPLLLILTETNRSAGEVITGEVFATEVLRALVGSVGLVSAVPITTALAVWALTPRPSTELGN
jgi:uncharacterized membrane protein